MKNGERIAATQLMVKFLGWKELKYIQLNKYYQLPKEFKHGLTVPDPASPAHCLIKDMRFHESMDWMLLVVDKIEAIKANGEPFEVTLSARKWGCHVDYFERGHYKPPTIIVSVTIKAEYEKGMSGHGFLMRTAPNKTEAVFIACYEFLKWAVKKKIIKFKSKGHAKAKSQRSTKKKS